MDRRHPKAHIRQQGSTLDLYSNWLCFGRRVFASRVVGLLFALSKVVELWPKVRAIFYSSEERRRAEQRRRFASHVTDQLNLLNTRETWQDYRFTELEAEMEADGRR